MHGWNGKSMQTRLHVIGASHLSWCAPSIPGGKHEDHRSRRVAVFDRVQRLRNLQGRRGEQEARLRRAQEFHVQMREGRQRDMWGVFIEQEARRRGEAQPHEEVRLRRRRKLSLAVAASVAAKGPARAGPFFAPPFLAREMHCAIMRLVAAFGRKYPSGVLAQKAAEAMTD